MNNLQIMASALHPISGLLTMAELQKKKELFSVMAENGNVNLEDVDKELRGMTVELFTFILIVGLAIYIWAIILLVQRWNKLPTWLGIYGIISVLFPIPSIQFIVNPLYFIILAYVCMEGCGWVPNSNKRKIS